VEEFEISPEVRERLELIGELIIFGVSPDKADGLSDAEMRLLEQHGPGFSALLEGRGLPPGFAAHLMKDVIPDMQKVRDDPAAREEVRLTIARYLNDPRKLDSLYRPGGDTYSDILNRAANGNGMFRETAHSGTGSAMNPSHVIDNVMPIGFERAPRAGRARRKV